MKIITYRPAFGYPAQHPYARLQAKQRTPALPVDIFADAEGYTLHADLPGFTAEQVQIEVIENRVTITAEQPEADHEETQALWRERSNGHTTLQRTLTLPAALNAEQAQADLKNGVLTLRVPLAESAKPRQVAIQA